ncbi:MAG: Maf family nucleotide pyrophosphatase [Acidimicrobiales bacterium]
MPPRRVVLASGSAARLRVLRDAGIDPEVAVSGVDEVVDTTDVREAVAVLAERKASAVADGRHAPLVLGCDSLLEIDGAAVGKPATPAAAVAMWEMTAGRDALLHTGQCLIDTRSGERRRAVASAVVHFGTPSADDVAAYVASGEPLALAGGFSIEGLGAPFVAGIDGNPGTVLGLSMPLFASMLTELGMSVTDLWRRRVDPVVRQLAATDGPWLAAVVRRRWGLPVLSTSGAHDPTRLAGFVVEEDGERSGVLTYRVDGAGIEVVTLDSLVPGHGVGSALLAAASDLARRRGVRLWLVTTNDNLRSLAFYQRRGMDIVALHRGFADEVRRSKSELPGAVDGIAVHHALELELLPDRRARG